MSKTNDPVNPNPAFGAAKTGLLSLLVVALAAVGIAAVLANRGSNVEQSANVASANELDLLEARAQLAWVHYDLLIDGLYAEVKGVEVDGSRLQAFQDTRSEAVNRLQAIGETPGPAADYANELLRNLDDSSFDTWPYPLLDLEDQHYLGITDQVGSQLAPGPTEPTDDLYETMLPMLVLADGLAVELIDRNLEPNPWSADYVEFTVEVLDGGAGWFGDDRQDPIRDSMVSAVGARPSPLVSRINGQAVADLRLVWDYDQWLIERFNDGELNEAPLDIDGLYRSVRSSTLELRRATLDDIAERRAAIPAAQGRTIQIALMVVAALGFAGSIVVFGVLVRRQLSRHRQMAELAFTDALTGARNHRFLERDVAERCNRTGNHHLLAMIDLDRFKMVNDTWGHDAGDALLVAIVSRLEHAAAELTEPLAGSCWSVVRPGGDEFIVALHAAVPFDLTVVESRIRATAGPVDLGLEQAIDLQFSLGLAVSDRPVEYSSLLKSADLAAYQDKSRRAAAFRGRQSAQPPGQATDLVADLAD